MKIARARRHRPNASLLAAAVALSMAAGAAQAAPAADLIEVWQAAAQNDRDVAVARAALQAARPKRDQAAALWKPHVIASTTVGVAGSDSDTRGAQFAAPGFGQSTGVAFSTSVNHGSSSRLAVSAVQPLYNPERRAQQRQLGLAVDLAELEWQAAQQALMLKTAQRYFDLALAEEALRVLKRQEGVVQQAYTEAQDRFQLGSVPVTDTHEARARLADMRAQVIAAEAELQIQREVLADSTGLPASALVARLPAARPDAAAPRPLDLALAEAAAGNLGVRSSSVATELARQETAKYSLRGAVAVDLVAQVSRDRLSGSGDFGSASNGAGQRMVGVQLSMPLFTGGYRSAKSDEALRLVDKASAQLDLSRQQAAQQVRATWLHLSASTQRLKALAEGLSASEARRDATRLGLQVGHRTMQDLLNAENDHAAARLALNAAQVAQVMQRLQLAALAGQLDEGGLQALNHELAPAVSP